MFTCAAQRVASTLRRYYSSYRPAVPTLTQTLTLSQSIWFIFRTISFIYRALSSIPTTYSLQQPRPSSHLKCLRCVWLQVLREETHFRVIMISAAACVILVLILTSTSWMRSTPAWARVHQRAEWTSLSIQCHVCMIDTMSCKLIDTMSWHCTAIDTIK